MPDDIRTAADSRALIVRPQPPAFLMPNSIQEVETLARKIAAAGWVPKSYIENGRVNVAKVEVAIMHGREVGLGPIAAVQNIAVINGMPSVWGDAMLAIVMDSTLLESIAEVYEGQGDELAAVCTAKRRGFPGTFEARFSVAMAKKAQLWSKQGPWQQYPSRMLKLRARSWALRDGFADVLRGLSSAEERLDALDMVLRADGTFGIADEQSAGRPAVARPKRSQFTGAADPVVPPNDAPAQPEPSPSEGEGDPVIEAEAETAAEPVAEGEPAVGWALIDDVGEVHEFGDAQAFADALLAHAEKLRKAKNAAGVVQMHENSQETIREAARVIGAGAFEEFFAIAAKARDAVQPKAQPKAEPAPAAEPEAKPAPAADPAPLPDLTVPMPQKDGQPNATEWFAIAKKAIADHRAAGHGPDVAKAWEAANAAGLQAVKATLRSWWPTLEKALNTWKAGG